MSWIVDRKNRRTYDPDTGNELLLDISSSDGVRHFRIRGPNVNFGFNASMIEAPTTNSERVNLNIPDAIAWYVFSGKQFPIR